jgi:hypothetical protein
MWCRVVTGDGWLTVSQVGGVLWHDSWVMPALVWCLCPISP